MRSTCFMPFESAVSPAAIATTATSMIRITPPRPATSALVLDFPLVCRAERRIDRDAAAAPCARGQIHRLGQAGKSADQPVDRAIVVIGVALHPQHPGMIGHGREQDRLNIVSLVEEELAGLEVSASSPILIETIGVAPPMTSGRAGRGRG